MPVPLQYRSQFIPTDFGAVENVLGMYRQDMGQREQQFDLAQQMQDQATANIYGMDTLDPDVLQQAGDALSQRIDDIVGKRGGDYGAAAKDISKLIAQESRNPIYGLNKRKLEQTKLLEQALARNPNLWVTQDPRNLELTKKGLSPEDISYGVLDPEEARKLAEKDLAYLDKTKLSGIRTTPEGYDVAAYAHGPSDEEISALMQNPEVINNLRSYFPQLPEGEFQDKLSSIVESAARSYQKSPEERVLGFNPRIRKALENVNENPYSAFIPTAPVGMEGIKNVYPIEKTKDFWKMPNDNSILGILHRDIKQDILNDSFTTDMGNEIKSLKETHGDLLKEFGTIDEAKKIVDNFGTFNHIPTGTESLVKESIQQDKAGFSFSDIFSERGVIPTENKTTEVSIKDREKFNRASKLVNEFENRLSARINKENSDMMKQFEHYDIFSGDDKTQKSTEQSMNRFQNFVSDQLNLTDFNFETSNNEDIDFSDQLELIEDGDENYKKAQEGNYKITGIAIDPLMGIKLKVETINKDGGTTTHIANPASPAIEQQLIRAYTGGNTESKHYKSYERFFYNRFGNSLIQNIEKAPELAPSQGITAGEYKKELQNKANNGMIDENAAKAIIIYLTDSGTNNNVIL